MEVTIFIGELGSLVKTKEPFTLEDKFSKLKEVIQKEAGIDMNSQIIIDEKGVDVTSTPVDKPIASDSKKSQYTFFAFNESLTESEAKKLVGKSRPGQADMQNLSIILAINNGLIEQDIEERYNFKPIFAASNYIQGIDIPSIQSYEQSFFNDYILLKKAHKTFKHTVSQGFKILREIDQQFTAFALINGSTSKTFDALYLQKNQIRKKFNEIYEENKSVLRMYHDGIQDLKKYDLHPKLKKEGKKFLIDIYYDEQQMNKWRDSCVRTNDSAYQKYDKVDKDFQNVKISIIDKNRPSEETIPENRKKDLEMQLQQIVTDIEPLLISIISTAYDDLKELHNKLNVFCSIDPQSHQIRQSQDYFINLENLKQKNREHQNLASQMEEHQKSLDILIDQIIMLKQKNAIQLITLNQKESQSKKELKKAGITFELIKYFSDLNARLIKDFAYLKHPSQLPTAYEKALVEVQRRKKFRKVIDEQFQKLQSFVNKEKDQRVNFLNNLGKILPSDFIPQLREQVPSLRIEGGAKDYDLPEFDDIESDLEFQNEFPSANNDSSKRVQELQKEISLLKEEHQQNIKDYCSRIEQQDVQLQLKMSQFKEVNQILVSKERDITKLKEEIEKTVKSLKDQALTYQFTQRSTDEALAKKIKELDALAKSKSCKGCIVCTEDLRGKPEAMVIKDLNDKLFEKSKQIQTMEEQLRKSATLINQVCQHNFNFLRQKTQDFHKAQDKSKAFYENKLMEVEDQLGLELKACNLVKQKLVLLEDKYQKCFSKETDLKKKLKDAQFQVQAQEREVKNHLLKIKDYQQQIVTLQQENQKLLSERKNGDDESKRMVVSLKQEVAQLQSNINKVKQEKLKLEDQLKQEATQTQERLNQLSQTLQKELDDKTKKITKLMKQRDQAVQDKTKVEEIQKQEAQKLRVQLNEMTERYESQMREKNEQILSLNNMINDQLDSNKKEQSVHKSFQDMLDKKEKELLQKNKDLQDTTLILSKRDREIQTLKQEISFMKEQIQVFKKDVEDQRSQLGAYKAKESEELERLKSQLKNRENSPKKGRGDSDVVLQRIKELACTTLNIQNYDTWENSLARALTANTYENVNFMTAMEGVRVLFMPHSPGVYIALVLKNVEDIEQDQALKSKDLNLLETSSIRSESGPSVKRLIIKNNLFLDIESLSKNLQIILNNYQMIVIAKIKSVTKHRTSESNNPYTLDDNETFFQCQIEKLEHIVGFESDEFSFTDYACK